MHCVAAGVIRSSRTKRSRHNRNQQAPPHPKRTTGASTSPATTDARAPSRPQTTTTTSACTTCGRGCELVTHGEAQTRCERLGTSRGALGGAGHTRWHTRQDHCIKFWCEQGPSSRTLPSVLLTVLFLTSGRFTRALQLRAACSHTIHTTLNPTDTMRRPAHLDPPYTLP